MEIKYDVNNDTNQQNHENSPILSDIYHTSKGNLL